MCVRRAPRGNATHHAFVRLTRVHDKQAEISRGMQMVQQSTQTSIRTHDRTTGISLSYGPPDRLFCLTPSNSRNLRS